MEPFARLDAAAAPIGVPNIDTDQIIPARFLTTTTKDGLGRNLFADWRYEKDGRERKEFVLNKPESRGAAVLVGGNNFGCGSSREHAPQALMRWGIRAIVGGSYGEIFFGNCVMLGIPCLTVSQADLEWLQREIGKAPQAPVHVDVDKQEVRFGERVIKAAVPEGPRKQLVAGTWDSTAVLLDAGAAIEATAGKLPYVKGY